MNRLAVARTLSIVAHPAVLMPAAAAVAASGHGAVGPVVLVAAVASVFVACCVGAYSVVQVRAGRWGHVDASVPSERRQLNVFLVVLLLATAGVLWASSQPWLIPLGLLTGASIVSVALLLRRWFKLSLHVAFAAYAACLPWPDLFAVSLGALLVPGVAWSRLVLGRHTGIEVVCGLLAGAVAGVMFKVLATIQ